MLWVGGEGMAASSLDKVERWSATMQTTNDLSRSLTPLDQDSTLIAVIDMSLSTWLVGGIVPGVARHPLKKLEPKAEDLLKLLHRWRDEAVKSGRPIARIAVAFEAGRDGFWLARWLREQGIEAYVIHAASIAVSREHRRAKTDRLDTELLKRAFLGWLRGERDHCRMVAVPTLTEEAADPRAREPGRRAQPRRQPDEGDIGPAGDPRLQSQAEEGTGTAGRGADPCRGAASTAHPGRVAA
jgi:transposase